MTYKKRFQKINDINPFGTFVPITFTFFYFGNYSFDFSIFIKFGILFVVFEVDEFEYNLQIMRFKMTDLINFFEAGFFKRNTNSEKSFKMADQNFEKSSDLRETQFPEVFEILDFEFGFKIRSIACIIII